MQDSYENKVHRMKSLPVASMQEWKTALWVWTLDQTNKQTQTKTSALKLENYCFRKSFTPLWLIWHRHCTCVLEPTLHHEWCYYYQRSTYIDVVVVMAVCNFPKGDLYSHESILEQKLRQKGVLNDDEYSSQDLDWILICTLAKKEAFFSKDHTIRTMLCSGERDSVTI